MARFDKLGREIPDVPLAVFSLSWPVQEGLCLSELGDMVAAFRQAAADAGYRESARERVDFAVPDGDRDEVWERVSRLDRRRGAPLFGPDVQVDARHALARKGESKG